MELRPDLAPSGVQHLTDFIESGYFGGEQVSFFRVNKWITQFGADEGSARPQFAKLRHWPDSQKDKNPCGDTRWHLGTFAMLGGNQMLIVINPNDAMGKAKLDAPAGYVVAGMDVVKRLHAYNDQIDNPNGGEGPDQGKLQAQGGRAYLKERFPQLDWIKSAVILPAAGAGAGSGTGTGAISKAKLVLHRKRTRTGDMWWGKGGLRGMHQC